MSSHALQSWPELPAAYTTRVLQIPRDASCKPTLTVPPLQSTASEGKLYGQQSFRVSHNVLYVLMSWPIMIRLCCCPCVGVVVTPSLDALIGQCVVQTLCLCSEHWDRHNQVYTAQLAHCGNAVLQVWPHPFVSNPQWPPKHHQSPDFTGQLCHVPHMWQDRHQR